MKHNDYLKIVVFIVLLFQACLSVASADDNANRGFDEGIKTAAALQGQASLAMQNFKPENFIKNYSPQPKEADYMNNADQMKNDAIQYRSKDTVGKSITEGMDERKKQFNYDIDPHSVAMINIEKRSQDIYDALTGEFSACTKQESCTTDYKNYSCEEAPKNIYQYCHKALNIDLIQKQVDTHYTISLHVATQYHDYAGVSVDAITGKIHFLGPHDTTFQLNKKLPADLDCKNLQGKVTQFNSKNPHTKLDNIAFPSCSNGMVLDCHVSNANKKGSIDLDMQIEITSTKVIQEPHDRWEDGCTGFSNTAVIPRQSG